MAASDSVTSFSQIDCTATLYDGGSNSLVLGLVQADAKWTIEGKPYTEARTRNQHQSPRPVLRVTGDGNVTGSMSLLVASFYGSAAVTPYEAVTLTGGASGWATTAAGDKKAVKLILAANATAASGASQTVTFAYLVATNIQIDPAGAEGLFMMTFDFTDHENEPAVA